MRNIPVFDVSDVSFALSEYAVHTRATERSAADMIASRRRLTGDQSFFTRQIDEITLAYNHNFHDRGYIDLEGE